MESPHARTNTYRLIVTRQNAREILLFRNGSRWAMPRAEICPHHRLAEQLTEEVSRSLGVETYCLLIPSFPTDGPGGEPKCAVMESVQPSESVPAGAAWVPCAAVDRSVEATEARLIRDALTELNTHATNDQAGLFARPGWLAELFRWAQEQIAPLGLRLTGAFRQLNASPTFSLIRLETESGAVWFKATGEPNSHELGVTVALARLFPAHVLQILGVHRGWNGWLSAEAPGASLDQIADFSAWERAAQELAELQIASIGKTTELLETAHVKDFRLSKLAESIDPFLSRMSELMAAQEKRSPAPLVQSELSTLAEGLKESCALLDSLHLPNTLGHLDFNPGNILVCEGRCVFLDWAEACVSNPLPTFEYLREHMARSRIGKPAAGECLTTAYLRPWTSFYSPEELRRALALSSLVAVFAYAVSNDWWRSPDLVRNSGHAGYFRSLTRRMYREAIRAAERSEPCLS
jgi:Phosphotransferase enzyme family